MFYQAVPLTWQAYRQEMIIKEVNRRTVKSVNDYEAAMGRVSKDNPVLLLIKRGGQTFYVSIKIS